jgi:hypothetical protein
MLEIESRESRSTLTCELMGENVVLFAEPVEGWALSSSNRYKFKMGNSKVWMKRDGECFKAEFGEKSGPSRLDRCTSTACGGANYME